MSANLYVTLMMGTVSAAPVSRAVIEALTEVQVTAAATSQSGFQLKLTLGKGSEVERGLADGTFDPRQRVIVVATVKGTPYVLMDGVITKQDVAPSAEAGASTLTLTGLDLSALMDIVDLSGIPYPAMPPPAIVGLILAKYVPFGVIPLPVPNLIPLVVSPTEKWSQHRGTDLAYVRSLGQRVGHVFYVDPGPLPGVSTAYWGPEIRHGSPQRALSVNLDAASNVESLTFSLDGLGRTQLVVVTHEKLTKIPLPIPVPDLEPLKPKLGRETVPIMKTKNLGLSKLGIAEAAQLALAIVSNSADAVTASGSLDVLRYGHVLMPRQLVAVRGAGDSFDGVYYVKSVTHTLGRGKFQQSFSLARGGVGSTISRVAA